MELERIQKRPEEYVGANLVDYDECAKTFSWTQARGLLDGLPGLSLIHIFLTRSGALALRLSHRRRIQLAAVRLRRSTQSRA